MDILTKHDQLLGYKMLEKRCMNLVMDLLSKPSILGVVLAGITVFHLAVNKLRTHFLLRRIPGPPQSSFIWGEEWELYHSTPGSLYSSWHKRYGSVVRFSGAFGVHLKILFQLEQII